MKHTRKIRKNRAYYREIERMQAVNVQNIVKKVQNSSFARMNNQHGRAACSSNLSKSNYSC